MGKMKRIAVVLACAAGALCGADLGSVRTVYVMPMSHGMEQHLASWLTAEHVFQVVSDPKLADAVLTDHVDAELTAALEEINPRAPAAPAGEAKDSTAPLNKLDKPVSSLGRAKGVFFLVDVKARQVLWSTFEAERRTDSRRLDRTASDIVSRLRRDLKQEQASGANVAPANSKERPAQQKEQPAKPKEPEAKAK
jgi:hypothetical protein